MTRSVLLPGLCFAVFLRLAFVRSSCRLFVLFFLFPLFALRWRCVVGGVVLVVVAVMVVVLEKLDIVVAEVVAVPFEVLQELVRRHSADVSSQVVCDIQINELSLPLG